VTVLDTHAITLTDVLARREIHSEYQPIVDLTSGEVVGNEALARGPEGPWRTPDRLFHAAREQGLVPALDLACRDAALTGAAAHGVGSPLTLFVNVEPDTLDAVLPEATVARHHDQTRDVRVVVEFTERALGANPADLLRSVDQVHRLGWGVALDDVGAEPLSLAFMSLLRPDVVKLDLHLVQQQPDREVARLMNAVNAYAERSGAVIVAEGIETTAHLDLARALGARLGQGWLLGLPDPHPVPVTTGTGLQLPDQSGAHSSRRGSPFACLPPGLALRRSPKSLLIEVSKHLEREALRLGPTAIVAATFQQARHFTPNTARRYTELAERVGFVCVLGEGLAPAPLPGVPARRPGRRPVPR